MAVLKANGSILKANGKILVHPETPGNTVVIGGRRYSFVVINQKKWLQQNLELVWDGLTEIFIDQNSDIPRYCYKNNDKELYGLDGTYPCGPFYNFGALKYINENPSLLPTGWHIPSRYEWDGLFSFVGTNNACTKLKAKDFSVTPQWPDGYGGTDDYDFHVLPTGIGYISAGDHFGRRCDIWCRPESQSLGTYMFMQQQTSVIFNNPDRGYFNIRLCCDV